MSFLLENLVTCFITLYNAIPIEANEQIIVEELNAAQGAPVNIGGYYEPKEELTEKAMRPSSTFNTILGTL